MSQTNTIGFEMEERTLRKSNNVNRLHIIFQTFIHFFTDIINRIAFFKYNKKYVAGAIGIGALAWLLLKHKK